MKKILLSLLLLYIPLLAEVTNVEVTPEYIKANKLKIIDIRTENEWREMGIIKDAYLITFFDESKINYAESFLKDLKKVVDKDEQFAIISNTASRTRLVSNFLGNKYSYNVINLIGGMSKLLEEGYKVEIYNSIDSNEVEQNEDNRTIK